jgi:hypothetical protein
VRKVRVPLRLATACALAVAPAAAFASPPQPSTASSALWATVDVCNPAGHPRTIGIRGSMPGTGDRAEQMYMQFRVEYRHKGLWSNVGPDAQSGWESVGNASARSRQAGQDFTLAAGASHSYLLRGVVTFEWRLHGRTTFATIRSTTEGHRPGAGADPSGYSAAECPIAEKRRGSLLITPLTPSAASRSITAGSSTVQG